MMLYSMKFVKFADYQRALEVAERFNEEMPKLPIKLALVGSRIEEESTETAPAKGAWYIDATSASPGRLQFFMDEMQRLEQDARKLDRYLRLPPQSGVPETVLETTIPVDKSKRTSKSKTKVVIENDDPFLAAMAGELVTGTEPETPSKKKGRRRNASSQEGDQPAAG